MAGWLPGQVPLSDVLVYRMACPLVRVESLRLMSRGKAAPIGKQKLWGVVHGSSASLKFAELGQVPWLSVLVHQRCMAWSSYWLDRYYCMEKELRVKTRLLKNSSPGLGP